MLWPGFVVALTHETTEIAAAAFLLAAILARVRGRTALHGALAATAMLARETTAPVFAGIVLHDLRAGRSGVRAGGGRERWRRCPCWRGTRRWFWRGRTRRPGR